MARQAPAQGPPVRKAGERIFDALDDTACRYEKLQ